MASAATLEQILWHIHNRFERGSVAVSGCAVTGGELPPSVAAIIPDGAWFWVSGSVFNDGLHKNDGAALADETFTGTVTVCGIPQALESLADEIEAWQASNGAASEGPYASESFGGYSYTLKSDSGGSGASGGLTGWRLAFKDRLNPWRKMH